MTKKVFDFSGTHKEVGIQTGEQYLKWQKILNIPTLANNYYPSQLRLYKKYYPQYLEFLDGVAQGMKIPKDKVYLYFLTSFLQVARNNPNKKCSTFVVKNKNGVLIGRNYDWLTSSEENSNILKYKFSDAFSVTGVSDMETRKYKEKFFLKDAFFLLDEAWNNHGLYINLHGAPGEKKQAGMSVCHIIHLVAETCKNTKEAIKLLEKIPLQESKIYTLADKLGNFAIVEKSIDKIRIRKSKRLIYTTNHYNHKDLILENENIFKTIPFHSTFARYHYLETMLKKNPDINLEEIIPMMNKPPTLQNWRDEDVATCWICALNLVTKKYEILFSPLTKPIMVKSTS